VETQPDFDPMRRNLLKMAGVGVAALGIATIADTPAAIARDRSNGADAFYTSDKVSLRKVAFKNQYQMNGIPRSSPCARP
jgi:hypothetical protein